MLTDIKAGSKSPSCDALIPPSKSVRRQSGRPEVGCSAVGTRSPVARRCRYPTPASGARHGTVDAVPGRGAASSTERGRMASKRRVMRMAPPERTVRVVVELGFTEASALARAAVVVTSVMGQREVNAADQGLLAFRSAVRLALSKDANKAG